MYFRLPDMTVDDNYDERIDEYVAQILKYFAATIFKIAVL